MVLFKWAFKKKTGWCFLGWVQLHQSCNQVCYAVHMLYTQRCTVGVKYPIPTFQNFLLPTLTSTFPKFLAPIPWHKGNEIWLLNSMEIVVHSKKPVFQQKFQKKLYHFN